VRLLTQPDDGIAPLLSGIRGAKKSIEIVIFRLDQKEIEAALKAAVVRGVSVRALIAYTNRAGERGLRKLEQRLLAGGVIVARTADDLIRYHDKFMIIDRSVLYLLAFNFTALDIKHSRSFGIITRHHRLVQEAVRLFEADMTRQPYTPGLDEFVVSPLNARKQLATFLKGARKQLLIYDTQVSDGQMVKILEGRARAGVEVRIIGEVTRKGSGLTVRKLPGMRLHTRTIIRDGHQAFVGSQSLRKAELEARREVGIIIRDPHVVKGLLTTFESDWERKAGAELSADLNKSLVSAAKAAKKAIKAVADDLPALLPEVKEAVISAVTEKIDLAPEADEVEDVVKEAVKEAVRETVKETVKETVREVVKEAVQDVEDAA